MEKISNISKMMLLGVSFLFLSNSYSQQDNLKGNKYFSLYLSNIFYAPLEIKTQGIQLLETAFSPSYEIGFEFSKFTHNKWGYQIGANFSSIGMSTFYYFYSKSIVLSNKYMLHDFERMDYFTARLTLNISGSKNFIISKRIMIHTQLGMNLNLIKLMPSEGGVSISDELGNSNRFFLMRLNSNSIFASTMSASLHAKIGISTILKNKNILTVNFIGNIHPTSIYTGDYYFNTIEYESKGIIKFKPSFFGLELNYAFLLGKTKKKKIQTKNKTKNKLIY